MKGTSKPNDSMAHDDIMRYSALYHHEPCV